MQLTSFKNVDFPLNVCSWIEHGNYPTHTHDFSEIAIIIHGSGTTKIRNQSFHFHAGDVFVLHAGCPHAYLDTHNLTLINVSYAPQVVELDRLDPGVMPGYQALFAIEPTLRSQQSCKHHLTLTPDQMIKVKALTDVMEMELRQERPGYKLAVSGGFLLLLTLLSRFYGETDAPDARKVLQLANALSYLEQHYTEPININELAKRAHMSRRSLFSNFSKITQQTPGAYLLRLRIMKAVELLETSDKNITEIAFDCGFQSSGFFSRQFKKVMKITPSDFKNKYNRYVGFYSRVPNRSLSFQR